MIKQKNFLLPSNQFEMEGLKEAVPKKVRGWIPRLFSILGFFAMTFGATILGLSFHRVGPTQVGYYPDETKLYNEGTYLELPWVNQKMRIIDTNPQRLEVENLSGHTNGGKLYNIKSLSVRYSITSKEQYIEHIKSCGSRDEFNDKLKILIQNEAQAQLRNLTVSEIVTKTSMTLLEDNQFGITVDETIFSTPTFPHTTQNEGMFSMIEELQNQLDELRNNAVVAVVNGVDTPTTTTAPINVTSEMA